jgi:trehalose utilization protein
MATKLKIEKNGDEILIVHLKMRSNFNCSYMVRSSLTYVRGFSVKYFFQPIYADYANWAYFDKRSYLNLLLWNRWTKLNQT